MLPRYDLGKYTGEISERVSILEKSSQSLNTDNANIRQTLKLEYATPNTIAYVNNHKYIISKMPADLILPTTHQTTVTANIDNTVNIGTVQDIDTTATPQFSGLTVDGNIAVSGTVDGVDISALDSDFTSHATNSTTAHFGQDLKSTATPTFAQISITNAPASASDVATKAYVDLNTGTASWQSSINSVYDPTGGLPLSPTYGDRHISAATANGWVQYHIYEWDNSVWQHTIPVDGYITYVIGGITYAQKIILYDSGTWNSIDSHISHQSLTGAGTNTHADIDNHIANSTTAHFGQDLKSTATPTFANVIVATEPTESYHLANKSYVDEVVQGVDWQKSVKSFYDPTSSLPISPTIGDRYICSVSARGWTINCVYEWNGASWVQTIPNSGYAVYVEDAQNTMLFNGTDWVQFGSTMDHTTLRNIGVNTHAQIDSHIANTTNAHFGQDLKITGTPSFAQLTVLSTNDTTSSSTGALQINGGVYVAKAMNANNLTLEGLIQTTSPTTGTLVVNGGAGFEENVNIEGQLHVYVTTDTTVVNYGACIIDGGLSVAKSAIIANNLTVNNNVRILSGDDTTSPSTGALQVFGGIGISNNLQIGNTTTTDTLIVISTNDATSISSGAVNINGGVSISGKTYLGSTLHGQTGEFTVVNILSTTQATDTETGALVINGGAGFAKDVYVGGTTHLQSLDIANLVGQTLHITATTDATSATTGAVIIDGGLGIANNVFANGNISADTLNIRSTNDATSLTTGSMQINGGVSINRNLQIGEQITSTTAHIISTIDSTDITTGALIVDSGVGIGGNLNIGTNLNVTGFGTIASLETTTGIESTSTSTGSIRVGGGIGIATNANIGGNLNLDGILTMTNTTDATDTQTGSTIIAGGIAVAKSAQVSVIHVVETTQSTSISTGSAIFEGGVGINANANITGKITIASTEDTTDASTGALQVSGGTYIAKDIIMQNSRSLTYEINNQDKSKILNDGILTLTTRNINSVGINCIIWVQDKGLYYAFTTATDILISYDGITWTSGIYTAPEIVYSACFAPELHKILIGCDGVIYVSSDYGTSWQQQTVFTIGDHIYRILWVKQLMKFYACTVRETISIKYSSDGTTWTSPTTSVDSGSDWVDIAYSDELNMLVAVSNNGNFGTAYSSDMGDNWTNGDNINLSSSICWSSELRCFIRSTTTSVYKSYDGITWNGRSMSFTTSLNMIMWLNNYHIFVGVNISHSIYYSYDGDTWVEVILTGTPQSIAGIAYSEDLRQIVLTNYIGYANNSIYSSNPNHGTKWFLDTFDSTSTSTGSVIALGGLAIAKNMTVGGDVNIAGAYVIASTNDATDTSSGAMQISGGLAVAKTIYTTTEHIVSTVNTSSINNGALIVDGGVSINKNTVIGGVLTVEDTTDATSISTGSVNVNGGISIAKSIYAGNLHLKDTTQADDLSTGTIIVDGGVSIKKNIIVGGNEIISETMTVQSTIDSTDTLTGAIVVAGGMAVAKYANIGNVHILDTTLTTSSTTGALIVNGGIGMGDGFYSNGNGVITGTLNILNTTDSTDIASGSVKIGGGMAIAKALYVDNEHILNTTISTSTTTGALLVAGGIGVGDGIYTNGNVNVGINLNVKGTTDATNTASGSAQILGGLAVAKTIYVQAVNSGSLTISNTTQSTSSSTGSTIIAGGLGVAKSAYFISSDVGDTKYMNFFATYVSTINGDFGGGVLTGTGTGTYAITGSKLVLDNSVSYITYASASNSTALTGAIKFKLTPLYTGTPATSQGFVSIGTNGTVNNQIIVSHTNEGDLTFNCYDSTGVLKLTTGGAWTPTSGTEYEIECDYNMTSGYSYVFVDGTQLGSAGSGTGTRTVGAIIQVGSDIATRVLYANFSMKELVIYSVAMHTMNYTLGYSLTGIYPKTGVNVGGDLYMTNGSNYLKMRINGGNSYGYMQGLYAKYGDGLNMTYNIFGDAGGNLIYPVRAGASIWRTGYTGIMGYVSDSSNPITPTLKFTIGQAAVTINTTADASATSNGSLIVTGGIGIAKNCYVGGTLRATSTTDASQTSSITGSAIIAGGIVVTKDLVYNTTHSLTNEINRQFMTAFNRDNLTTIATRFTSGTGIHAIIWIPDIGQFIACESTSYNIISSYDGINWAYTGYTLPSVRGVCITYSYELHMLVVGSTVGDVVYSIDYGITWTKVASVFSSSATKVIWVKELAKFFMIASAATVRLKYSTDGSTWITPTIVPVDATKIWYDLCYSPSLNMIVAASTNNAVSYSVDGGDTWITATAGGTKCICWSPELKCFLTTGTTAVYKSFDGINWKSLAVTFESLSYRVVWISDYHVFICVTSTTMYYSFDGDTWYSFVISAGQTLYNISYATELHMLVITNIQTGTQPRIFTNIPSYYVARIMNTYDSTSSSTGSLITLGGASITKNMNVYGTLYTQSTIDATSSSTGSIQVIGGMGVMKNLNVGGTLTAGTFAMTTAHLTATDNATSSSSGSLIVDGGVGIQKDLYVGGTLNANALAFTSSHITATDNATSGSTGALIVDGGIGVAKDLFVAGTLTANALAFTSSHITATDDASSTSTGALIVDGGIGMGKSLIVGSTNDTSSTSTGAVQIFGGVSLAKSLYVGGTNDASSVSTGALHVNGGTSISGNGYINGILNVTSTQDTTDTLTGSVQIAGGITVNKNMRINGSLDSSSTTTGSLQITSGMAVGQSVNIGGDLTTNGNATIIGTLSITNTTDSTSITTGSVQIAGGIGIAYTASIGNIHVFETTESSSSSTGALLVNGGVGIGQSLHVTGTIHSLSTVDTTDNSSGALTVDGGVGISKDIVYNRTHSLSYETGHMFESLVNNDNLLSYTAILANTDTYTTVRWIADIGRFLAFANSTYNIMASLDGINWSVYAGTTPIYVTSACYAHEIRTIIIGGTLGDIAYSTNYGITWTTVAAVFDSSPVQRIIWVKEVSKYFAVTDNGVTARIQYSSDGITWNTPSVPADMSSAWCDICYSPELALFVAVSYNGNYSTSYSTNGDVWVDAETSNMSKGICWSPELRCFVRTIATNVYKSFDGINWINRTASFTDSLAELKWIAQYHMFVGISLGANMYYSYDGDTWYFIVIEVGQTLSNIEYALELRMLAITNSKVGTVNRIYTNTPAYGVTKIMNTYDATGLSSGSIQVAGGVSIAGSIYIGGSSNVFGSEVISITTDSSSTSTGALQVLGGVGIAKNVNVGGTMDTTSTTTGAVQITGGVAIGKTLSVTDIMTYGSTQSTSTSTGSIIIKGGVGIGGKLNVGDILSSGASTLTTVTIINTANATSTSTGSVRIAGGVSIANSLFIGSTNDATSASTGAVRVSGGVQVTKSMNIAGTLDASSTTTGSLQVVGGAAIGGNIYAGETVDIAGILTVHSTVDSTSATTGAVIIDGGMSIGNTLVIGGTNDASSISTGALQVVGGAEITKTLIVGSTNATTSISTGALQVLGGMSITKNVLIGSTNESSSSSTGSLVVVGGIGVAKNVYIASTHDATSASVGALRVAGGIAVASSIHIAGTNDSTSISTGAVVIKGGIGIYYNMNVGGNEVIAGTLNVQTNTESTNTQTGTVQIAGGVGIGKNVNIGGSLTASATTIQTLNITSTSDTTSSTTGALQVAGGAYIAKDVIIGGTLVSTSASTGAVKVIGGVGIGGAVFIGSTTDTTSISTGAIQISGGIGITKGIYIGSTNDTSSSSTGAVIIAGGVRIAKSIYVGESTETTSTTTGAAQILGGMSVGKSLYVAGDITMGTSANDYQKFTLGGGNSTGYLTGNFTKWGDGVNLTYNVYTDGSTEYYPNAAGQASRLQVGYNTVKTYISDSVGVSPTSKLSVGVSSVSIDCTTNSSGTNTGALVVSGGVGIAGKLNVGEQTTLMTIDVVSTFDSTSVSTGAITVAGGVGIKKSLYSKQIYITTTDNTTSSSTGSLQVAGGAYIAKDVIIGGTLVSTSASTGAVKVIGGVGIGGAVFIGSTTDTTSISTGAIQISGGIGITKGIYIGSTNDTSSSSTGAAIIAGGVRITKSIYVGGTNDTTSTTTGAVQIAGGVAIGKNMYVAGDITMGTSAADYQKFILGGGNSTGYLTGNFTKWGDGVNLTYNIYTDGTNEYFPNAAGQASRVRVGYNSIKSYISDSVGASPTSKMTIGVASVNVECTTNASGTSTGSLVVDGGAGIAQKLYVGGQTTLTTLTTTTTTNATSTSTGSIIIAGGIGIAKDMHIGGNLTTNNLSFTSSQESTSTSTGSLVLAGGLGIAKNLNVGGTLTTNSLSFVSSAESTSISTGALVLAGGLGIAKNVNIGGILIVTTTNNATSTSTGSLIVSGGLGVNSKAYLGTNAQVGDVKNITFVAVYSSNIDGDYGLGNLTGISVGAYSFISSKLVLGDALRYITYTAVGNADFATIGTIKFKLTPLFTGEPSYNEGIISIGTNGTTNNSIQLYYGTDGLMHALVYGQTGNIVNISIAYDLMSGVEIEIELDVDISSGNTNLYINGYNYAHDTNTGARVAPSTLQIGSDIATQTYYSNFAIRDVVIYNVVKHTNDYQSGYSTQNIVPISGVGIGGDLYVGKSGANYNKIRVYGGNANGYISGASLWGNGINIAYNMYVDANNNEIYDTDSNASRMQIGANGFNFYTTTQVGSSPTEILAGTADGLSIYTNSSSTSFSTGALTVAGGIGVGENMHVAGTLYADSGIISASTSTGAIVVNGGIGISNRLYTTNSNIVSTTDSSLTSSTTGALIVSGGINIAKDVVYNGTHSVYKEMTNESMSNYNNDNLRTLTGTFSSSYQVYACIWMPDVCKFMAFEIATNRILVSIDGKNWTYSSATLPSGEYGYSACYSQEVHTIVVCSMNGYINYSTDYGITWTKGTNMFGAIVTRVYWIKEIGRFFALTPRPDDVQIKYSTDGITWSTPTTPMNTSSYWSDICYSPQLGMLITTAYIGSYSMAYSTDSGNTWTNLIAGTNAGTVCWCPELGCFVAIGISNSYKSFDGINWKSTASTMSVPLRICWLAHYHMFVASAGTYIYYSFDGDNWTQQTPTGSFDNFVYSRELRVLVCVNSLAGTYNRFYYNLPTYSSMRIMTTNDATSTSVGSLVISGGVGIGKKLYVGNDVYFNTTRSLTYEMGHSKVNNINNDNTLVLTARYTNSNTSIGAVWIPDIWKFYVINETASPIITSSDGINWTTSAYSTPTSNATCVCYSHELNRLLIGDSNGNISYSNDYGSTWTTVNVFGSSVLNIIWISDNNMTDFYAVGTPSSPTAIKYSTDGITWNTPSIPPHTSTSWRNICYSYELVMLVMTASSGTYTTAYSTDAGGTWINGTVDQPCLSIAWSPELGCFSRTNTTSAFRSRDGINWTSTPIIIASPMTTECWNSDYHLFMGVTGYASVIYISYDGDTWTGIGTGSVNSCISIAYSQELHMLVTSSYGTNSLTQRIASNTPKYIGTKVNVTYESSSTSTGSLLVAGGIGIAKNCYIGGTLHVINTTSATSTSTGSCVISGGISVAKECYIGSTIEATSSSTGATIISGGVGIAKNCYIGGTLVKGGGSFLINHPDPNKTDWKLRHCFVESNTRGDNMYRYTIQTSNLTATIPLPTYFKHLNENPQVWVSPQKGLSMCCGCVDDKQENVIIEVSKDGIYNVLVVGTRKDQMMKDYWDEYGAEIPPENK